MPISFFILACQFRFLKSAPCLHVSYSRVNEMTYHVQNGTTSWNSRCQEEAAVPFLLKPAYELSCANSMCQSLCLASLLTAWTPIWWLADLHAEKLDKTEKQEFACLSKL